MQSEIRFLGDMTRGEWRNLSEYLEENNLWGSNDDTSNILDQYGVSEAHKKIYGYNNECS